MRWGFLGIGRVTPRMVEAIQSLPTHIVCAAAARSAEALQEWGTRFHVTSLSSDMESLCRSDCVDAIYVALPPHLHADLAIEAMNHGKVVLCEKPLTANFADAMRLGLVASQTQASIHHATGFPFHPRSLAMREVIRSGRLGTLHRIVCACSASHILHRGRDHRLDPLSGGCLFDLGWYCVYATLWFTGLYPKTIRAIGRRHPDYGIWTSAQAIVELDGGVVAHWDCGFDAAGRKWIEFAGSDESLICDDFLRPWDLSKPRFWIHGHDGKAACEIHGQNHCQESTLIASIERRPTADSQASIALALKTQQILESWEQAMEN